MPERLVEQALLQNGDVVLEADEVGRPPEALPPEEAVIRGHHDRKDHKGEKHEDGRARQQCDFQTLGPTDSAPARAGRRQHLRATSGPRAIARCILSDRQALGTEIAAHRLLLSALCGGGVHSLDDACDVTLTSEQIHDTDVQSAAHVLAANRVEPERDVWC